MSDMSVKNNNLLEQSCLPILLAFSLMIFGIGFYNFIQNSSVGPLVIAGATFFLLVISIWFFKLNKRSRHATAHNLFSAVLFMIMSEVVLFFGFFFAHFYNFLGINPNAELWPPFDFSMPSPFALPLINTLILVVSGFILVWARGQISNNRLVATLGILATILLGITFLSLQAHEYGLLSFSLEDGAYPSIFYMITGLHGLHVLLGVIALSITCIRVGFNYTNANDVNFKATEYYWHFVDAVWILLYLSVYLTV